MTPDMIGSFFIGFMIGMLIGILMVAYFLLKDLKDEDEHDGT